MATQRIDALFRGHKIKQADIANLSSVEFESLLQKFSPRTFSTIKIKFDSEVDLNKFWSFVAELRFGSVLPMLDPNLEFLCPERATPTADIRATIGGVQVEFEVSRLVPESELYVSKGMNAIVNIFVDKVRYELAQLSSPSSIIVVAPERAWSVEKTYRYILRDLKKVLTNSPSFASLPCIIIHLQYQSANPIGWILTNPNANQELPNSVISPLVSVGFK